MNVLRSEGQAFGERLRYAGVDVTVLCIQGIIHNFVMLNALDQTNACRMAMDVSTAWINGALPLPFSNMRKIQRIGVAGDISPILKDKRKIFCAEMTDIKKRKPFLPWGGFRFTFL